MAVKDRGNIRRLSVALLTSVAVCALPLTAPLVHAQSLSDSATTAVELPDDAKLLLAANELVYDRDAERVERFAGPCFEGGALLFIFAHRFPHLSMF